MNMYLKNIVLSTVMAASLAMGLSACTSKDPNDPIVVPIAPKDNAHKQKVYSYLLDEQGIDIIKVGETRTIVIASDRLFITGSANLEKTYAGNLKIIAQLINSYDVTQVAVTVYTDQAGEVARALTEKQAQKVLTYLKKHNVDTRLIYAKGYGNSYPVTSDNENSQLNRRIEIKFQFHQE